MYFLLCVRGICVLLINLARPDPGQVGKGGHSVDPSNGYGGPKTRPSGDNHAVSAPDPMLGVRFTTSPIMKLTSVWVFEPSSSASAAGCP
jgi:hypothetical protein